MRYQFADALATKLTPGSYFILDGVEDNYVWFTIDGRGSDPAPFDPAKGIRVDLKSEDGPEKTLFTLNQDGDGNFFALDLSYFTFNSGAAQYKVQFNTEWSEDEIPECQWVGNTLYVTYLPAAPNPEQLASVYITPNPTAGTTFVLNGQTFTWTEGYTDLAAGEISEGDPMNELLAAMAYHGYTAWDNGDGTVLVEETDPWENFAFDESGGGATISVRNDYVPESPTIPGTSGSVMAEAIATAFAQKSDVVVSSAVNSFTVTNVQTVAVTQAQDSGGSGVAISVLNKGGPAATANAISTLVGAALTASGKYSVQPGLAEGELIVTNLTLGRSTLTMDVNTGIVLTDVVNPGSGRDDYSVGQMPHSPALADLDGDGLVDLVQSNCTSNTVSVLLNRGNGTFGPNSNYAAGSSPIGEAVLADLNGDGRPDIVQSSSNTAYISVLLNLGDGTFAAKTDYAVGTGHVDSPTLGDLNGDGLLDIVQANRDSNNVSVLLNRGDGTFGAAANYAVGTSPLKATLGDVNGDGRPDIVQSNSNSASVSVLINQGNGTFGVKTDYAVGNSPMGASALADLNGDGRLDIVQSNRDSNSVSVLFNQGNGTFGARTDYAMGSALNSGSSLVDLNGDGRPDIVQTATGWNSVSVRLNQGNGTFGTLTNYAVGSYPFSSAALADLNGDGKPDIVQANNTSKTVSVLLNKGDGTFNAKTDYGVGNDPFYSPALRDLNGDGRLDIVQTNRVSNSLSVLLNKGDGTFAGNPSRAVTRLIFGDARGMTQVNQIDLTTQSSAKSAMITLDSRLERLSAQKGVFGSVEARLQAAAQVVAAGVENFRAAEGRIKDADIGQDTADLTRTQIIQQAASAVLTQANQQPQIVLQLLAS